LPRQAAAEPEFHSSVAVFAAYSARSGEQSDRHVLRDAFAVRA